MPSLPGRGYPVRGGLRAADDGIGDIIPGEAEIQGEVFGIWGGNGGGADVSPSTDTVWESSGRETEMGYHKPR